MRSIRHFSAAFFAVGLASLVLTVLIEQSAPSLTVYMLVLSVVAVLALLVAVPSALLLAKTNLSQSARNIFSGLIAGLVPGLFVFVTLWRSGTVTSHGKIIVLDGMPTLLGLAEVVLYFLTFGALGAFAGFLYWFAAFRFRSIDPQ